jgi:hypothetical protein
LYHLRLLSLVVATWLVAALGLYELTAKSPLLTGQPLPGWWATERAERTTRWQPPTGVFALDKLLHEGEEAARFYATLAGYRPRHRTHPR